MPHYIRHPGSSKEDGVLAEHYPTGLKELKCSGKEQALDNKEVICRFAKTKTLPLKIKFNDTLYSEHIVSISTLRDEISVVFPVRMSVKFRGDEDDLVQFDQIADFAVATFRYQDRSVMHSHGVTVKIQSYKIAEDSKKTLDWRVLLPPSLEMEALQEELMTEKREKAKLEVYVKEVEAQRDKLEKAQVDLKLQHQEAMKRAQANRGNFSMEAPHGGYSQMRDPQDGQQQTCVQRGCAIS